MEAFLDKLEEHAGTLLIAANVTGFVLAVWLLIIAR